MTNTFIQLSRKIMEWEWYTNPNVVRLFIHCLLRANHKDNTWQGMVIKRGSFISSYDKIANELDLSKDQVRYAFKKLCSTGEITTQGTNKYLTVSICKYDDYQYSKDKKKDGFTTQIPHKSHSNPTQIPPNNNDNNDNNENNYTSTTRVREICFENKVWVEAVKGNYALSQDQFDGYLDKFTNHCLTQGKTNTSPADFKKHFLSWYKKHTGKGMNGRKILKYKKPTL